MKASKGVAPFAVHEAEVLVVGGGLAGMTAAFAAERGGASVVIVDKGPFGHSGNTGINWGHSFETAELSTDGGAAGVHFLVRDTFGMVDQEHAQKVIRAQIESRPRQTIERFGNVFQRDDEGNIVGVSKDDGLSASPDAHITAFAQHIRRKNIPIFENMMMLDILLGSNNRVVGIVALDYLTGTYHVFRAKRVVLATGGYHWAKGVSAGSHEATGDAHALLLKRGLAFKDMEFPQYDFSGIRPFGWRPDIEQDMLEIGISLSVNGEVHNRMVSPEEKRLTAWMFEDGEISQDETFQGALIAAAKEFYAGRGTTGDGSGNGLLFDLRGIMDDSSELAYPTYKGHIINVEHNMGYVFPPLYETIANEYSSCGIPRIDPATNETEIEGLYAAFTALSVRSSMYAWAQGYLAGKDAAQKVKDEELLPYNEQEVKLALENAEALLAAQHKGGIRSVEVFRSIQRTFYQGYGYLKSKDAMDRALVELKRIEAEDLPKMICADRMRVCNRDWRQALEAPHILLCAQASIMAGLARRESRAPFFRKDYPKMDNSEFLCSLWTRLSSNGEWIVEKEGIVDSLVSVANIKVMIDDSKPLFDISIPNRYR